MGIGLVALNKWEHIPSWLQGLAAILTALVAVAGFLVARDSGPQPDADALLPPSARSPSPDEAPREDQPVVAPRPPPPALLAPSAVDATSVAPPGKDSRGQRITYEPEHLTDHNPSTAWRTPGNGLGQQLRLAFAGPVRVRRVGLIPGYAKIDPFDGTDRFMQNRIVRSVRYLFDDGTVVAAAFSPQPVLQFTDVDVLTGTVTVEIVLTSEHGGRDFTAVSDIEVFGFRP